MWFFPTYDQTGKRPQVPLHLEALSKHRIARFDSQLLGIFRKYFCPPLFTTPESGINVAPWINIAAGKFGKKNKRRAMFIPDSRVRESSILNWKQLFLGFLDASKVHFFCALCSVTRQTLLDLEEKEGEYSISCLVTLIQPTQQHVFFVCTS